ncbi:MAG: endonuclease [Saprospirales bacterium]|nr:endonuclease [Saprospirales bacterium]MBK8921935.1 endonuclease [Saprospirales bacterium]
MIRILHLLLLFYAGQPGLIAQVYTPVFPSLSGPALFDSTVAHYKPVVVLDYANARDTLYARVLAADDDSLRCIYSGYTLWLDPTKDPTQYIYLNGSPLGMNTEHAYPQSKGAAEGNARSDMHHLYPARIPVNEARGEAPYADIPDAQTQQWFYKAQILFSIPPQNKDLYSEFKTGAFEPRESVKGDLARAVFYFYTMYRAEALLADPNFFDIQRPALCQWHDQDPADSTELIKTWRIAPYQENKPNPFILDCTLARRLYCPELPPGCSSTPATEAGLQRLELRLSPNPVAGSGQVEMTLPFSGDVEIRLLGIAGNPLATWKIPDATAGNFRLAIEIPAGCRGQIGVLQVRLSGGNRFAMQAIPVSLL